MKELREVGGRHRQIRILEVRRSGGAFVLSGFISRPGLDGWVFAEDPAGVVRCYRADVAGRELRRAVASDLEVPRPFEGPLQRCVLVSEYFARANCLRGGLERSGRKSFADLRD